ncbi:MAG TPA: hypothetical protein VJI68_03265 [Candidatus Nanoarchaeia archaeon]|nr:hypothetical protein [Candidatus Nanoarchaeia archaeon]
MVEAIRLEGRIENSICSYERPIKALNATECAYQGTCPYQRTVELSFELEPIGPLCELNKYRPKAEVRLPIILDTK